MQYQVEPYAFRSLYYTEMNIHYSNYPLFSAYFYAAVTFRLVLRVKDRAKTK